MTERLQLIQAKLRHLARMQEYSGFSLIQVEKVLPVQDWNASTPNQHESLAAFDLLSKEAPTLMGHFTRLQDHCNRTYRI